MTFSFLAAPLLVLAAGGGTTIYVDDDNCPGPGDGSIRNPYCSIQTAIDNSMNGDEIVVAPGTYFETIDFIGKAITVHSSGGRDVTIIDAQQMGSVVTTTHCEGPDTVLGGFTITGGNASHGGGMFNIGSNPTVTNCTFSGNSASGGGGMYNSSSNPSVTNCTFSGNSASSGGGMYNQGGSPTVTDCTFSGNSANSGGGGMYNYTTSPTISGCRFEDNSTFLNGGGMWNSTSSPSVTDCTFSGNSASDWGGGMYNDYGSSPTVTNCTFSGNSANSGGGMLNIVSTPAVTDCTFSGNSANSGGGGMFNYSSARVTNCMFSGNSASSGGGMYNFFGSPRVTSCTFSENSANSVGGMLNGGGSPTVANCVLWGNSPVDIGGIGPVTVRYTDVQGGFPGIGNIDADPLFVDPDNGNYRLSAGSPCIDAGLNSAVPHDITTDLDGNPRFLEIPETPDCQQAPGTCGDLPVVDMGAYESLGGGCLAVTSQEVVCHADGETFTVNVEGLNACTGGTSMFTFTGSGGDVGEDFCFTAIINDDQGGFCCSTQICVPVPDCSEPACPCDLDGDGSVSTVDLLALLAAWLTDPSGPPDFDGDGNVGTADLLELLANWEPCP